MFQKKKTLTFDDKIQEIFEKLINKNKIDGIYTLKLSKKQYLKDLEIRKYKKITNLLTSNANVKIYSEEEAKEVN